MAYSMKRALYRGDEFKKQFPNEKEYRHSLKEEDDGVETVVTIDPGKEDSATSSTKACAICWKYRTRGCWTAGS